MPRWFGENNRRAAPRRRYDGNNARIGLEGSLTRRCQVVDLSRTGARLVVTNAYDLPSTFILLLSKHSGGRLARVKWRRGNEVGAEFFTVNPARASRLTVVSPNSVGPQGDEGQKSTPSLHGQAQHQGVGQLNPVAQKVVASVSVDKAKAGSSGDKTKTEVNCQITDEQRDWADQEKNSEKKMDLSQLQKKLGPDHVALIDALKEVDPESPHGQELAAIIKSLDDSQSSPQSAAAGQRPIN